MRNDVDFGTIPGTPKPTLYKPGAEKICSLFQLAPRVLVTDMSHPDVVAYQVRVELFTIGGVFCGEGVGSASSAESKYQWRSSVCKEEWDAAPEDRRRVTYKRGKNNSFYTIAQVRTEPSDQDNTILKMAKKRALIDAVLTVTAASDIFTQDAEDDPNAGYDDTQPTTQPTTQGQTSGQSTTPAQTSQTRQQQPQQGNQRPAQPANPALISPAQSNRFYALASGAKKTSDQVKLYLFERFQIEHSRDLTKRDYDEACAWAQSTTAVHTSLNPDAEDAELDDFLNRANA
jgi:hypothetical protein